MAQRSRREVLTVDAACEAVGVSRRTMYYWMSNGKVEFIRTASGKARIFTDSLWRTGNVPVQPSDTEEDE
jgi:excisionase family DNA binding protein